MGKATSSLECLLRLGDEVGTYFLELVVRALYECGACVIM